MFVCYLLLLRGSSYVAPSTKVAVEDIHHPLAHFSLCLRCVTMGAGDGSSVGGGWLSNHTDMNNVIYPRNMELSCRLLYLFCYETHQNR